MGNANPIADTVGYGIFFVGWIAASLLALLFMWWFIQRYK